LSAGWRSLFKFADEVEKWVKDEREQVDKITQSVLSKAFKGELTQDSRQAVKNWKNLSLERRKRYLNPPPVIYSLRAGGGNSPMKKLFTLTGKSFKYKGSLNEELNYIPI